MCSALERRAVQGLVMPSRLRKTLGARNGERFRVTAVVERFGHKNGWVGDVRTVLLKDLRDANTDTELADHLWFTAGAKDLQEGDRIAFTARVTPYQKGYFGRREDVWVPPSVDFRLERPTAVEKLKASH